METINVNRRTDDSFTTGRGNQFQIEAKGIDGNLSLSRLADNQSNARIAISSNSDGSIKDLTTNRQIAEALVVHNESSTNDHVEVNETNQRQPSRSYIIENRARTPLEIMQLHQFKRFG